MSTDVDHAAAMSDRSILLDLSGGQAVADLSAAVRAVCSILGDTPETNALIDAVREMASHTNFMRDTFTTHVAHLTEQNRLLSETVRIVSRFDRPEPGWSDD